MCVCAWCSGIWVWCGVVWCGVWVWVYVRACACMHGVVVVACDRCGMCVWCGVVWCVGVINPVIDSVFSHASI